MKSYRSYSAGESIAWAGDRLEFLGSVVTGVATLSHTLEDGRRQLVGFLLPSDFVGRPGRERAQYDITAVTDTVICRFDKAAFEKLLLESDAISGRLLEMMMDELDAARDWMTTLGRKTAREKIASFLCILARRQAALGRREEDDAISFDLPVTRETIADYLGLTLETVSRQISALKRDEVIRLEGLRHVVIPSFEALLTESGDDSDGGLPS